MEQQTYFDGAIQDNAVYVALSTYLDSVGYRDTGEVASFGGVIYTRYSQGGDSADIFLAKNASIRWAQDNEEGIKSSKIFIPTVVEAMKLKGVRIMAQNALQDILG